MNSVNQQTDKLLTRGGGFATGGMKKDPISGNEVPPGALPHEVRDDVPAQLSEGEFVVPASVVRFIGLDRLMKMRDKAIEGLKRMNDMGQMGNSEEAKASGENPLGQFDQEEEEGDEGFDEEIDDIMMATGGSVPSFKSTQQYDPNDRWWSPQVQDAALFTREQMKDPRIQQAFATFGASNRESDQESGYSENNLPMLPYEIRKFLTENGYAGPLDESAWDMSLSREYQDAAPKMNFAPNMGISYDAEGNMVYTPPTPEEQAALDTSNAQLGNQGVDYYNQYIASGKSMSPLQDWLNERGLTYQSGIHQGNGASQWTQLNRLVDASGKPVVVDAHTNRRGANDRTNDALKTAGAVMAAYMAPQMLALEAGSIGAGAAAGAAGGGTSAMLNGGSAKDILMAAAKGGITGGAGAGVGQYVGDVGGKAWGNFLNSDILPESWMNNLADASNYIGNTFGGGSSTAASTVTDAGLFNPVTVTGNAAGAAAGAGSALGALGGAAGTAAGIASGITGVGKPDVVLDKTEITGQRPVPDNSNIGGVVGGIVGGNVSPVTPDVKIDKVEVVGERKEPDTTAGAIGGIAGPITVADPGKFDKVEVVGKKPDKPKDDYLDNLPIIQNPIDPTPVNRVPDKAPDAPTKDNGKTKLPKLPIREALLAAGIGAIAKSGGSSDAGGGATTLSRGNNPVVDYRPVDNQMEQLFINNRPTGRMKKKYAVGGDVNLDAYNFFAQRD